MNSRRYWGLAGVVWLVCAAAVWADDTPPTPLSMADFKREVAAYQETVRQRAIELRGAVQAAAAAHERALVAANDARRSAARPVHQLDRAIQQLERGYERRNAHLVETVRELESVIAEQEQRLLEGSGDQSKLIHNLDQNKLLLEQVLAQIELDRDNEGVVAERARLQTARAEAAAALDAALEAEYEATVVLNRAWAEVDRLEGLHASAKLDYEAFLDRAPALLRMEAPPHLVRVRVVDRDNVRVLYDASVIPSETAHEQWHLAVEAADMLLREQRETLAAVRREYREIHGQMMIAHHNWMDLNARYRNQVSNNALWFTLIDSIDSISGILMNETPAHMLTDAVLELGTKLWDAKYGDTPAFAKFPTLPDEWIRVRQQQASGNPAAEAALRFGIEGMSADQAERTSAFLETYRVQTAQAGGEAAADRSALGQVWDSTGITARGVGVAAFRTALNGTIKSIVNDPKVILHARRHGLLMSLEVRYLAHLGRMSGAPLSEATVKQALSQVQAARRSISGSVINEAWRAKPTIRKISQSLTESLVKSVGTNLAKQAALNEQFEIVAQMFVEELAWLHYRRLFHYTAAQLRVEQARLKIIEEERDRLRAVNDQTLDLRRRQREADELLEEDRTYELELTFSRPVQDVRVSMDLPEPPQIRPLDTDADEVTSRLAHRFELYLPELDSPNWPAAPVRARLRVEAVGSPDHKLDGDPLTVATYSIPDDAWSGYEAGVDDTHGLRIAQPRQEPVSLVLLIDGSGSMKEHGRLEEAKASAIRLLEDEALLGRGAEVALWTFTDGRPRLLQDFTTDRAVLAQTIQTLTAEGDTPLAESIRLAGQHLLRRGLFSKKILVVLSDGEADDQGQVAHAIAQVQERAVEMRKDGW